MFRKLNLLFSAILTSFFSFIFFITKEQPNKLEIKIPNKKFKLITLTEENISLLEKGYWYVAISNDLSKLKEKIEKALEKTNVAILEIKSFSDAYLASKFRISLLPKEVVVYNGLVNPFYSNGGSRIHQSDFWHAFDIYVTICFSYYHDFYYKSLLEILSEGGISVTKLYGGGRSSMSFVILF